MKTNFKNFQKLLKIYKRKGDTTQMKNKKVNSTIKNHKEERLELFDKKIKEKFETNEEFFKNFRFREDTFKRKLFEGSLSMSEVHKTDELLDITLEELMFLYFGETPEEQNKLLITEEMMKGQSEEVKSFLRATNKILKGKSIEEDLKGSDSK